MKQALFIILSFLAQQTICADKAAANSATPPTTPPTATPAHSRQQSTLNGSAELEHDTSGLSDKVKALLAKAGTLIFRSPTANADKKDETES